MIKLYCLLFQHLSQPLTHKQYLGIRSNSLDTWQPLKIKKKTVITKDLRITSGIRKYFLRGYKYRNMS